MATHPKRVSVEEIREALRSPASDTPDDAMTPEQTESLAHVTEVTEKALRAQKRAHDAATEAMRVAADALLSVTYGHGKAPAQAASNEEILAARGVATEEDQAGEQEIAFAKAALRQLGLLTSKVDEDYQELYEELMRQAMHVAVSSVKRGHIRSTSFMTGHSDQTLRRLLELPENYPGYQATCAPTVSATRWGPRRVKKAA